MVWICAIIIALPLIANAQAYYRYFVDFGETVGSLVVKAGMLWYILAMHDAFDRPYAPVDALLSEVHKLPLYAQAVYKLCISYVIGPC